MASPRRYVDEEQFGQVTKRIEDKVDRLTDRVNKADWNGRGPVIKALSELAPYLIEMAIAHKDEIEVGKAERLLADRRRQRWAGHLRRFGITTGHRAMVAALTALGIVGTAFWGADAFLSTLHHLGLLPGYR